MISKSAFNIAVRQGYQPAPAIERRNSRNIEGVDRQVDIIVLAA
jgi:hypothetical protein